MKNIGFFCLLFVLALTACRKNVDEVTTTETTPDPPIIKQWQQIIVPVTGDVRGFVSDENGEPVLDAKVRLGNLITTTDDFGHFFFTDANLNARGTLVRIEKEGYFPGSRRFFAIDDAENRVKIELITKNFEHSFDTQAGGTVEMNGGATVKFSPNSIRLADGTPYNGVVRVAAKWLDPDDMRTYDRMPGNLQGVDNLAEEVVLTTGGMMAVELESDTGEPLNILEGHTAEISMPIPGPLVGNAPNEIPNWSYNEEHGMWVEEGVSTLQGNMYVGEVSHFSYWNHDFKDPLIEFIATFVDENGVPLVDYAVSISQPGTCLSGWGHTCDRGIVSGLIPQNYDLVLQVHGLCNEVLYSQDIGPFPNNVDLGTIVVPNSTLNPTTLQGELINCDGDPVQNGIVIFKFDGETIYEYTNGAPFDILFSTCSATTDIEVVGVDLDDLLQSDPITVGVGGTTDLGQISVCDVQVQNYIRVNVDGVEAIYLPASISPDSSGGTFINYWDQNNQNYTYLGFWGETVGNYDGGNGNFIEVLQDNTNGWSFGGSFDNFEVTAFGNIGEEVIGNFSGTLTNTFTQPPTTVTVTGDFNIIRQ